MQQRNNQYQQKLLCVCDSVLIITHTVLLRVRLVGAPVTRFSTSCIASTLWSGMLICLTLSAVLRRLSTDAWGASMQKFLQRIAPDTSPSDIPVIFIVIPQQ